MKSIIEEASSVVKAIEKAWLQAGKPQEFSIKIFEQSKKNFIGITTTPAKIGIFFSEQATPYKEPEHIKKKEQPRKGTVPLAKKQPVTHDTVTEKTERQPKIFWSHEMISSMQVWMKDILDIIGKSHIKFTTDAKRYYLKINFNTAIVDDAKKEQILFRNLAYISMQFLRNKFKKRFNGLKVIFTSNRYESKP